ncbi:MAG TPA: hypothetical protein VHG09_07305, partial [Longimicrobiales bacterium]|nr:hypothetical protein [Longimicrobiales bacterium]
MSGPPVSARAARGSHARPDAAAAETASAARTSPLGAPASAAATLPLGAHVRADGTTSFVVWAPNADRMRLRLRDRDVPPIEMEKAERGYHTVVLADAPAGTRYGFVLPDGAELPDPASRYQPEGIHGPSEVVSTAFDWRTESWRAPDLHDLVIYEMHVGTFTAGGTFDAAIERLPALRELGVTAVEIMPIAQFPGSRNWGYDGVL